ncbi:MAG: DUF7507 domain-containing protein [Propionibacteriaceae bacterium]
MTAPVVQMGNLTASMTAAFPEQVNPPYSTGDSSLAPADASVTCLRTATLDSAGNGSAGSKLVGNGNVSYLSHGKPAEGVCPRGYIADVTNQSSIGFAPMAPTEAPAGSPFLLGQVSHQNWVINTQRKDSVSGASKLYGDLNLNFGAAVAGTDSFAWNLLETVNNARYEQDVNGNPLYLWAEWDGSRFTYSYKTSPQNAEDSPSSVLSRDAQGNILYEQLSYNRNTGRWYVSGVSTTPDPNSATDERFFRPKYDNTGYVDDVTEFSEVRSTKIFNTSGGLPYRLVIRGFTPSEGECTPTPQSGKVTQKFVTKENAVTYGCLYASWEQDRPVIIEKEAKNLSATTPVIPKFNYDTKQWVPATGEFTEPTTGLGDNGWRDFSLNPTGFDNAGIVRSRRQLLVPNDGVRITEDPPAPALTSTQAGWKLTKVQCVQGPAKVDPSDPTVYTPAEVDWSQSGSAKFPFVKNKDGSDIRVDLATGQADLANVGMSETTATLAITCRYVNTYDDKPTASIKKVVSAGQANPVTPATDGSFTVSYDIVLSNSSTLESATYAAITDKPGFASGLTVTNVTIDGKAVTAANGVYPVAPAGTLDAGAAKTFKVVVTGKAALTAATKPVAGVCNTEGNGAAGSGLFNAVVMNGDPDTTDNDACVPVIPTQFAVKKNVAGKADGVSGDKLVVTGNTWTATYTVTLTNTGTIKGTSQPITDTPSVPSGFAISDATVDGAKVTPAAGPFTVTPGVELEPGKTKTFTIILNGTIDTAKADWTKIGVCDLNADGDPAKGLFNKVDMTGDTDGSDNNDACVPVVPAPQFEVEKNVAGKANGVAGDAMVISGNTWTATYEVVVTNNGPITATSAAVTDQPMVPAGFTVTGATVDGVKVDPAAGPFTVTPGVELDAKGTKKFTVVLTGSVDLAKADWSAAGSCDLANGGTDSKGLFNKVSMDGDGDVNNNDACVPVTAFKVEKQVTSSAPLVLKRGQDSVEVGYKVVVTNLGAAGKHPAVVDVPTVPAGFTVKSVKLAGNEITAPYTIPAADVAANGTAEYAITVTLGVDQGKVDWSAVGVCENSGAGNPAKGLFNKVDMTGDTDGVDNNDACVPVQNTAFAVKKATQDTAATLGPDTKELTRSYKVEVSNTGTADGTSDPVYDIPSKPAGFTIKKVTVGGVEVTADADGRYLVTAGDAIAKGAAPVSHDVVVTYAIDTTKLGADDWARIGECKVDGANTDPSKGIYNVVTLEGDTDGVDNNDVCTPVTAVSTFKVNKSTSTTNIVLDKNAKSAEASYTVTVTNNGPKQEKSPKVTDTPAQSAGFTVSKVVVDGKEITPLAIPVVVTDGDDLAAGASKAHTIVVTYTVDQTAVKDWSTLGKCTDANGKDDPNGGLRNSVDMTGDTDGTENNTACVPVTPVSEFAVEKTSADGPVKLTPEQTSLTRNYTVKVTNTGNGEGTSAVVVDTPSVPTGFEIVKVTVDGTEVKAPYTVTSGDTLAAGAAKDHKVVVEYKVTQSAINDWTDLGVCSDKGDKPDSTKGLYNLVTMDKDSDGPDNNDVCTPVAGTPTFKVSKTTTAPEIVLDKNATSATVKYTVTVTNTSKIDGDHPQVVDTPELPAGFTLASVKIDGAAAAAPYTIASNALAAGQSREYTVEVTYTVDQKLVTDEAWKNLGTCDAADTTPDKSKGLYNLVSMDGDTDGADNNDACVPVTPVAEFKVEKSTQDGPAVLTPDQKSLTRTYTVTVTNTSPKADKHPDITDTPSVPAGFTITSVSVDGAAVAAPYVISGQQLEARASKSYTIVVVFAVDQAKVTDWTSLNECKTDGASTNPNKGIYNMVTMAGDVDGADNNDVCTPVTGTPTFKVEKSVVGGLQVLAPGATSVTATYTVTAHNNGPVSGQHPAIVETPEAPAGFTIDKVTVGGTELTAPYTIAPAALEPGASTSYTVAVTYKVDQAAVKDWPSLGECKNDGAGDASKGLFNKVAMEGDTDGPDNNDACTPVTATPTFKVSKSTAQEPVTLAVGQTEVSRNYTVTVVNNGPVPGIHPSIVDTPSVPAGFSIASVTVDGAVLAAPYSIAGVELAKDGSKAYNVVVTYTVDQAAVKDWPSLGECKNDGAGDPSKGLSNTVAMEGDTDGPDNNDACTPVKGTPVFQVNKLTNAAPVLLSEGQSTVTVAYEVTVSNTGFVAGTSAEVTDVPSVPVGFSIAKVTIDGKEATAPYVVTPGDELAGGTRRTHVVEVTLSIDTAKITDWSSLSECKTDGAGDPSKGLFNKVEMTGDADGPDNNDACVIAGRPSIAIVKLINGDDANDAPGVEVKAGSMMNITFRVTNNGTVALSDVKVTDDKVAAEAISCPKTTLEAGEVMECTATLAAPAAGENHVDTGTATGTPPAGPDGKAPAPVNAEDKAHAHTPKAPAPKLPRTGAPAMAAGVAVAGVLLIGLGYILVRKRKQS